MSPLLKNLQDEALPENFHAKLMRKILLIKFRNIAIVTCIFLLINLIFIIEKIVSNLSDSQALPIIGSFVKDAEFNWSYWSVLFNITSTVLPINLILFALLNLILSSYIFSMYKKELKF